MIRLGGCHYLGIVQVWLNYEWNANECSRIFIILPFSNSFARSIARPSSIRVHSKYLGCVPLFWVIVNKSTTHDRQRWRLRRQLPSCNGIIELRRRRRSILYPEFDGRLISTHTGTGVASQWICRLWIKIAPSTTGRSLLLLGDRQPVAGSTYKLLARRYTNGLCNFLPAK